MESVKRYDCTNGKARHCYGCYEMTELPNGEYVSGDDFDRVSAENLALQQRLTVLDQLLREVVDSCALFIASPQTSADTMGLHYRIDSALNPTDEAEDMAIQREREDNVAFQAAFGNRPADAGGYGDDAPCPECGDRNCNGECMGCP